MPYKDPEMARASKKAWQLKNRAKEILRKRAYYLKNKASINAKSSAEFAKKKSHYMALHKIYMKERPGLAGIYVKRWRDKNRKRFNATTRAAYKRNPEPAINRARKRQHPTDGKMMSSGIAKRLMVSQNGLCNYCKADLSITKYHRDHIIPVCKGGSHEDSNIQLLCPTCNLKKGIKIYDKTAA